MMNLMMRSRLALEPIVGMVFGLLWAIAEAGRDNGLGFGALLVVYSALIAISRRFSVVAIVGVNSIPILQLAGLLPTLSATTWPIYFAAAIVAFLSAIVAPSRLRWLSLVLGMLQAAAVALVLVAQRWSAESGAFGSPLPAREVLVIAMVGATAYVAAWSAGSIINISAKRRRERVLLDQAEIDLTVTSYELALVRDRENIAREVHDVLAHSLAVVIAVADGSRYQLAERPESTEPALREIADTARTALGDLRGLIEGLRDVPDDRPQPGLADLEPLVRRLSMTDLTVSLEQFGEPSNLSAARQLAVFRIVQESLTNALKHGGAGSTARVCLDWRGPGLALSIVSDGDQGEPDVDSIAAGFGVASMSERARLAGGWLSAGFTGGQFLVTSYIPGDRSHVGADERAA